MHKSVSNRKIALWGAGNMTKSIMNNYVDFKPELIIDNYKKTDSLNGVKIVNPEDIKDLKQYYIVVSVLSYDAIKKQLDAKGLKENEDYCDFKTYFNIGNISTGEFLKKLEMFLLKNPEYIGADYYGGHFLSARKTDMLANFYSKYGRNKRKHIFVAHAAAVSEEIASKLFGAPFFSLPNITNWQGYKREKIDYELEKKCLSEIELNANERQYCIDLQEMYPVEDKELSLAICFLIMKFYKQLLALLKPNHILIGTDLNPEYRILKYLAEVNNIPYRFWEYGWIPGTILVEQYGNTGRSRVAKEKEYYISLENKYNKNQIERIKEYVLSTGLDTVDFRISKNDIVELKKYSSEKKTIFLVGGGFELNINSKSKFFKENISSLYENEIELVELLNNICIEHDYNFIYKPHPDITTFLYKKQERSKSVIWIEDMSVDDLIEKSDVVVTIYSAVDCKALMHEKPVVQLGHSILDNASCSYIVNIIDDLSEIIQVAINEGMTDAQKDNFDELLGKILTNCSWDNLDKLDIEYGKNVDEDFFE